MPSDDENDVTHAVHSSFHGFAAARANLDDADNKVKYVNVQLFYSHF